MCNLLKLSIAALTVLIFPIIPASVYGQGGDPQSEVPIVDTGLDDGGAPTVGAAPGGYVIASRRLLAATGLRLWVEAPVTETMSYRFTAAYAVIHRPTISNRERFLPHLVPVSLDVLIDLYPQRQASSHMALDLAIGAAAVFYDYSGDHRIYPAGESPYAIDYDFGPTVSVLASLVFTDRLSVVAEAGGMSSLPQARSEISCMGWAAVGIAMKL